MIGLVAVASACIASAGPLDAYRANMNEAKVRVWFTINAYEIKDFEPLAGRLRAFTPNFSCTSTPTHICNGEWAYDGATEYNIIRETGGSRHDPTGRRGLIPTTELIADEALFASHPTYPGAVPPEGHDLFVYPGSAPVRPVPGVGPFIWSSTTRIDEEMISNFGANPSARLDRTLNTSPLKVEIYQRQQQGFTLRREIWYEPNSNFVPRFIRSIAFGEDKGKSVASVKEWYLLDLKHLDSGSFVPSEWVYCWFHADSFATKYPDYNESTLLTPTDTVTLFHFKATKFEAQEMPVRLEETNKIERIMAPGGLLPVKNLPPLTMAELKTLLGPNARAKASTASPLLPNIDTVEVQAALPRDESRGRLLRLIAGALALAAVIALALFWTRRKSIAR